jgi:hypothetical protein
VVASCLWQALPTKTNKEIRQIIIASADRFTSPDNQYGYGIPNFSAALNKGLATTRIFLKVIFYVSKSNH